MSRTILHAAILASLAAASVPSRAHAIVGPKSSAQDRSTAFVADGDTAFERGDYEEAITKYRAAYYGLTAAQRTSYVGSIPVRNAMRAYALLLAERQDRRVLEQQLGFLTEFLESVRSSEGGVTRVGQPVVDQLEQTRAEAEQKLSALAQVVAPPPELEEEGDGEGEEGQPGGELPPLDGDDEGSTTPKKPSPLPPPPAPRRALGLGLAIGGGVTAGIGGGVMVGWWTVRNNALAEAEAQWGDDVSSSEREAYLRAQWYRARRHLITGSVLAGVGVATAAAGTAILLIQRNRALDDVTLGLSPTLGPDGAGMLLAGRF